MAEETSGQAGADRNRLFWQCRRGMLELDLLLRTFVERHADELDVTEYAALLRLLKEPDQTLQGWLFGNDRPTDGEIRDVVQRIRATDPS
ncbi:MAG: succinate dehydrogenase assembly factor 2 [Pseudomonadota bacterium]